MFVCIVHTCTCSYVWWYLSFIFLPLEKPDDQLHALVVDITKYCLDHNAEAEACDLLMEMDCIDQIIEYVSESIYERVCLYLARFVIVWFYIHLASMLSMMVLMMNQIAYIHIYALYWYWNYMIITVSLWFLWFLYMVNSSCKCFCLYSSVYLLYACTLQFVLHVKGMYNMNSWVLAMFIVSIIW